MYLIDDRADEARSAAADERAADAADRADTLDAACVRAADLGALHGMAAGSWVVDGNTSPTALAALIVGIDDGDPIIFDALPDSPLSGEWADDYSVRELIVDTLPDAAEDEADEIVAAYLDAWQTAMVDEAYRSAAAMLPDPAA